MPRPRGNRGARAARCHGVFLFLVVVAGPTGSAPGSPALCPLHPPGLPPLRDGARATLASTTDGRVRPGTGGYRHRSTTCRVIPRTSARGHGQQQGPIPGPGQPRFIDPAAERRKGAHAAPQGSDRMSVEMVNPTVAEPVARYLPWAFPRPEVAVPLAEAPPLSAEPLPARPLGPGVARQAWAVPGGPR